MIYSRRLAAAEILAHRGIALGVIDLPWLNRVDERWLQETVGQIPLVSVVEDHSPVGGLGDHVLRILASTEWMRIGRFEVFGVDDYPVFGTPAEALAAHRLDARRSPPASRNACDRVRPLREDPPALFRSPSTPNGAPSSNVKTTGGRRGPSGRPRTPRIDRHEFGATTSMYPPRNNVGGGVDPSGRARPHPALRSLSSRLSAGRNRPLPGSSLLHRRRSSENLCASVVTTRRSRYFGASGCPCTPTVNSSPPKNRPRLVKSPPRCPTPKSGHCVATAWQSVNTRLLERCGFSPVETSAAWRALKRWSDDTSRLHF